jgi:hypothetical protein
VSKEEPVILIRPADYRERLKELAVRMAEDFGRDITLEVNVDRSNKIVKLSVKVHNLSDTDHRYEPTRIGEVIPQCGLTFPVRVFFCAQITWR